MKLFFGYKYKSHPFVLWSNDGMRLQVQQMGLIAGPKYHVLASTAQIKLFEVSPKWDDVQWPPYPNKRLLKYEKTTFVWYDLETNSLDIDSPTFAVLQLAAIKMTPDGHFSRFVTYMTRDNLTIDPDASKVNGLTVDDWRIKGAPSEKEGFDTFLRFVGDSPDVVLIAHNGYRFDHRILLTKTSGFNNVSFADSWVSAKRLLPYCKRYNLMTCVEHVGVDLDQVVRNVKEKWDWRQLLDRYAEKPMGMTAEKLGSLCANAHDAAFDTEAMCQFYLKSAMKQDKKTGKWVVYNY